MKFKVLLLAGLLLEAMAYCVGVPSVVMCVSGGWGDSAFEWFVISLIGSVVFALAGLTLGCLATAPKKICVIAGWVTFALSFCFCPLLPGLEGAALLIVFLLFGVPVAALFVLMVYACSRTWSWRLVGRLLRLIPLFILAFGTSLVTAVFVDEIWGINIYSFDAYAFQQVLSNPLLMPFLVSVSFLSVFWGGRYKTEGGRLAATLVIADALTLSVVFPYTLVAGASC